MVKVEASKHWLFAYIWARSRLEILVWGFDYDKESTGHNYIGLQNPHEFVEIIDGLLRDIEDLPQGDIAILKKIRERLLTKIAPAYESGHAAAHELWASASIKDIDIYMNTSPDDYQTLAKNKADATFSMSEKSWFIEGFSVQWQHEWADKVRRDYESEQDNSPLY